MIFDFFRRKKTALQAVFKPSLSDVTFAQDDWELESQNDDYIRWFTDKREAALMRLFNPSGWSLDCQNLVTAETYWREQAQAQSGDLVELMSLNLNGIPALRGIFKYRSPQAGSLALYYVGIIWIPFRDFFYQINYETVERGATGAREAAVVLLSENRTEMVEQQEPEMLTSMDELFEKLRDTTVKKTPSDDAKYDDAFPEHPLSRVRYWLNRFPEQVKLSHELKSQPVYVKK